MILHPPARAANLADVGPGELVRLKWSGVVRYALTAEWQRLDGLMRLLFLLPQDAQDTPTFSHYRNTLLHLPVVSFGKEFIISYDPSKSPTLPGDGSSDAVGFFVSSNGLVFKAAAPGRNGQPPDIWDSLEMIVDTGMVPQDGRPSLLGLISEWSIALPGLNGGPGTTLVAFPPEAAP